MRSGEDKHENLERHYTTLSPEDKNIEESAQNPRNDLLPDTLIYMNILSSHPVIIRGTTDGQGSFRLLKIRKNETGTISRTIHSSTYR